MNDTPRKAVLDAFDSDQPTQSWVKTVCNWSIWLIFCMSKEHATS